MHRKGSIILWTCNAAPTTPTTPTTTATTANATSISSMTTTATTTTMTEDKIAALDKLHLEDQATHRVEPADSGRNSSAPALQDQAVSDAAAAPASGLSCDRKNTVRRERYRLTIVHEDIIRAGFWEAHPGIIPYLSRTEIKKLARKTKRSKRKLGEVENNEN